MMFSKVEAKDLREMGTEELKTKLSGCEKEYMKARQMKYSQNLSPEELKVARKNVARCKMVINEKKFLEAVEKYRGAKRIPKQLRPRLTKAMRMRLKPAQLKLKSSFRRKELKKYPQKIFSFKE